MHTTLTEVYGNPSSIHASGRKARALIEEARKQIAGGLGASTGEIFFTSGATEANNMILINSIKDLGVERIISTTIEHHCILHTLDYIKELGSAEVVLLPVNNSGRFDMSILEKLLADSTKKTMVTIMHANNEIGVINDMSHLAELCTEYKAYLHMDTAQTIGKLPIDLRETSVSFIVGAAHKFHGPKGCGFMYISGANQISPMIHGGDQERGMRSGTENIYGIAGMAKAFRLATEEMPSRTKVMTELRNHFITRVNNELADVHENCTGAVLPNILSLSFPKSPKSTMLMMNLDIAGVAASGGSACSSGVENESHVLEAIGHIPDRKTIRFSFSHMNSIAEIDQVIDILKTLTPII